MGARAALFIYGPPRRVPLEEVWQRFVDRHKKPLELSFSSAGKGNIIGQVFSVMESLRYHLPPLSCLVHWCIGLNEMVRHMLFQQLSELGLSTFDWKEVLQPGNTPYFCKSYYQQIMKSKNPAFEGHQYRLLFLHNPDVHISSCLRQCQRNI